MSGVNVCPRCRVTIHHSTAGISLYVSGVGNVHAGCMTQNEIVNLPIYNLDMMPRWGLSDETMDTLRVFVQRFIEADEKRPGE